MSESNLLSYRNYFRMTPRPTRTSYTEKIVCAARGLKSAGGSHRGRRDLGVVVVSQRGRAALAMFALDIPRREH